MLKRMFTVAIITMTLLEIARAQRPAFSGLRPPGGLSQKDKYHATQNTAVENITGVDIATRFGEPSSSQKPALVNLPFGASQRPPVGVPLVLPISGSAQDSDFSVANRFGAENNPESTSQSTSSTAGSPATSVTPVLSQLPIDAHGDREWVNHLSQLPVEQQPFWFINYQAIEAHRNSSRPNVGALETRGSFFRG
ncbi:uncharacterized protein LOC6544129 [Drosophila erecta]|uniref:Uncharacterized protein n=1 Tax=Drosophila erecta TaxID=7220 RepID=B3NIZ0_DROER|nr:uncharacterized protein LOC6544129 [Drosophila erecta]EDV52707.1 uncharacterized protein Dere_GG13204 [Drosophila erecta]